MSAYSVAPVSTSTAFAQLHSAVIGVELARDVAHLSGGFGTKTIKGSKHWYYAFRDIDQKVRQLYVGPDSPDVLRLVSTANASEPKERLRALAKSALALGCAPIERKHLTVITRLNEFGFFRAGGVLVGTHAFLAYANMLGLRWVESSQTSDVDFAHAGRNLSIALPTSMRAEPHAAITTMEEGFLPLIQYRGGAGASYRHKDEPEFQVDFLCPKTSDSEDPIQVANLDVALQPLRFMEFSLEGVLQTTLFDASGRCVVVTLPAPERYAVHKLLVVGERGGSMRIKVAKDLAQASALISRFGAEDPEALVDAWQDAINRGPGWKKRCLEGRNALSRASPGLEAFLPI
jgi:hypothetical protein